MLARRAEVAIASAGLFALPGRHAAWGAGSAWPFSDRSALADAVIGTQDVPGPAACLAVSGALACAGALVAGWPSRRPVVRPAGVGRAPRRITRRGPPGPDGASPAG